MPISLNKEDHTVKPVLRQAFKHEGSRGCSRAHVSLVIPGCARSTTGWIDEYVDGNTARSRLMIPDLNDGYPFRPIFEILRIISSCEGQPLGWAYASGQSAKYGALNRIIKFVYPYAFSKQHIYRWCAVTIGDKRIK